MTNVNNQNRNQGNNNNGRGGNPMTNQQNNKLVLSKSTEALLRTTVDIEPIGIFFNIESNAIVEFTKAYFRASGIEVFAAGLKVVTEGRDNPRVKLGVFFEKDSDLIIDNLKNISPIARRHMTSEGFKPTAKLINALRPIAKSPKLNVVNDKVSAEINVIKILQIMLNAKPHTTALAVMEVTKLGKLDSILSVVKMEKFDTKGPSSNRQVERLMEKL